MLASHALFSRQCACSEPRCEKLPVEHIGPTHSEPRIGRHTSFAPAHRSLHTLRSSHRSLATNSSLPPVCSLANALARPPPSHSSFTHVWFVYTHVWSVHTCVWQCDSVWHMYTFARPPRYHSLRSCPLHSCPCFPLPNPRSARAKLCETTG